MNDKILQEDLRTFVSNFKQYKEFENKCFIITGSTGLIGSLLIRCLVSLNDKFNLNIKIFCVSRNDFRLKHFFPEGKDDNIVWVSYKNFKDFFINYKENRVDYIIHCAAPTESKYFIEKPVETIDDLYGLTHEALELAKLLNITSMVYLSSLEAYGTIYDDTIPVTEEVQGYIDPINARSSYSMGKRLAECLCFSYYKEHNVPVKVARLAQTFGAGVSNSDNRVFSYFAQKAIRHEDIILATKGELKRSYCYTIDAIDGILKILLYANNGKVYNVANEETYISIWDMATLVVKNFMPECQVKYMANKSSDEYSPVTKIKMSSSKLKELGWNAKYDLVEMYNRLISYLK